MTRWTWRLLGLLAAVVAAAPGCDGGPPLVPVTGTLTLEGEPLGEVEVVFVPDPARGTSGDTASGTTDPQGRFTLRTGKAGMDGVAPGFYRVTITDLSGVADLTAPDVAPPGAGLAGPKPSNSRPRVPTVYADAARMPLRDVEVRTGGPPLNFDLKAAAR